MTTIRITTAAGTNASSVADSHVLGNFEAPVNWRNSVDRCDSDGCGRVFIDCDHRADAEYIAEQLDTDDRVSSYEIL